MIALTLLLLAQTYTIDPEPIVQIDEGWMQDVFEHWDESNLGKGNTVGQRIDIQITNQITGEVLPESWWVPESYGFTVDSRDLGAFEAGRHASEVARNQESTPVLVTEVDHHLYFTMPSTHLRYFMVRWLNCRACYPEVRNPGLLSRIVKSARESKRIGSDDAYDVLVEKVDLWPDTPLTWGGLQRMGTREFRERTIYLQPWMLRFVRVYVGKESRINANPVPTWIKQLLGNNERWIKRAERSVENGGLATFYVANGYIPGDRSVLDMQYNWDLRATITPTEAIRRITYGTRCEPEFGPRGFGPGGRFTECAEQLWLEELDASRREVSEIDALIERYLGGN